MAQEFRSLAEARPDISAQWHPTKNGELTPDKIASRSSKKVWWLCDKGHEFQQTVDKRVSRGYGCPFCSGRRVLVGYNDLATVDPVLASEWDYEKNGDLLPSQVTHHSNKWAWWKCTTCGHSWRTKINDRANGRGCPVCAGKQRIISFRESRYLRRGENDLATLRPDLVAEWSEEKNGDRRPSDFTCNSSEMIWWKCSICGKEWQATIANRASNNSGCPKCMQYNRTSFPEQALFFYVRQLFPEAENGYTEVFKPRKMELDIYIPEIHTGIEYDGKAWHKGSGEKEREKYRICQEKGIRFIRVAEESSLSAEACDAFVLREDGTSNALDDAIEKVLALIYSRSVDVNTERDRSQIILQYVNYIKGRSIAERYPWAIKLWDIEKNGGLTPWMVSASANTRYWWKCEKGHSYKMTPSNKCYGGNGCPVCSGKQVLSGYNDLQTRYPQIATEWDDEKNAPIKACEVMPGSMKKYWWRCSKGHSYLKRTNDRTANKSGCPICAGKTVLQGFNDLGTTKPETAAKWDYEKNGDLTPQQVTAGSMASVWWRCDKGHSWKRSVSQQTASDICPICSFRIFQKGVNDLATTHPDLVSEWDWEKNEEEPSGFMRTSAIRVWWKCKKCGGEWQQEIRVRISHGSDCPFCSEAKKRETFAKNVKAQKRDLVSRFPEIAAEWDYERNAPLDPTMLTPGSNHKVWWICPKGHHYQSWISDRTGKWKTGCPYCAGKRKITPADENWTGETPE